MSERELDDEIEQGNYTSRPAIEQNLLKLFETIQKSYILIYGNHGVGETTLIKQVIKQSREQGIPIFYCSVEKQEGESFLESFSVALKGFDVIPQSSSLPTNLLLKEIFGFGRKTPDSVAALFPDLVKAGNLLKEKTKRRPLLIIDACNNLEDKVLIDLQDFAKEQADKKQMLVVFVASEGKSLKTLFRRSAASRMQPYRIGELSKEEANKYLEPKGVKDVGLRSKILDITGYSFQYLSEVNDCNLHSTKTFVSTSIQGYLTELNLDTWALDNKFLKVVTTILENGSVTYEEFIRTIEDVERVNKMLSGNIFSIHLDETSTVSFKNTATHNFFKRKF